MPDHPPILFYDLVAQKDIGAPYFSPATIRARLGFALKKVPIQTVEVSAAQAGMWRGAWLTWMHDR